ncbi:MAG: tyrosine-type recombinase/integrase, partial [Verrucomicrobiota bacterium]|nr:tyrosine-type recombinase/integrase [Verrucomicrobiota bacterium]
ALLNEMVVKAAREGSGLIDPAAEEFNRPISEHLTEYEAFLRNKNDTEEHIGKTISRINAVLSVCKYTLIIEIKAARVAKYLADRRSGGLSPKTSNYYLTALKGFTRWLVREQRLMNDPIQHLQRVNPQTDVRTTRRTLSSEEFKRLIQTTREDPSDYRDLSGLDRATLYLIAANTGFRAKELASLTERSFMLDADPPMVQVAAAYSKRRRLDVQPLPQWVAEQFRNWLKSRSVQQAGKIRMEGHPQKNRQPDVNDPKRLWPGTWFERAAEMLRTDLGAAGIPFRDIDGRVFDFHALRHQYISNLAAAGVHPRVAQQLARHSTIHLTMQAYTHLEVADLAGAVNKLPELPSSSSSEANGSSLVP